MNRAMKLIKDGFLGVTRNFALSLSSVSSVTITLILMGIFLLLSSNIQAITTRMEQSVQISAYVSNKFESKDDIARIEKEIKSDANVLESKFSSKDEEIEIFIQQQGGDDRAEEMYGAYRGDNNPFRNVFLVTVKDGLKINDTGKTIGLIDGIETVKIGGSAQDFMTGLESVRTVGFAIVIALAVIAVFLISNTIRVSIFSRRREIGIMRQVGAGNWYIRWPFIIEGIIIGLLGSLVPVVIVIFGYQYLLDRTGGNFLTSMFGLLPAQPLVYEVSLVLVGLGVIVGCVGSIFSVGRFLRWQR